MAMTGQGSSLARSIVVRYHLPPTTCNLLPPATYTYRPPAPLSSRTLRVKHFEFLTRRRVQLRPVEFSNDRLDHDMQTSRSVKAHDESLNTAEFGPSRWRGVHSA